MLYVVKRDGRKVEFDVVKISNAIKGAAEEIAFDMKESENISLTQKVIKKIEDSNKEEISVEDIQNLVEHVLIDSGFKEIGYAYSNYRRERTKIREIKSELMTAIEK
ncbi:ATP cone domain-containing protein [Clostridium botulinum]|nr:ATP cone domain-containing protein [Clostridium botulinum]